MKAQNIQSTRNYRLFTIHACENRPLDLRKHKKLAGSMERYGFLPSFPVVVVRDENGNLVVKDGQHRLAIAETLGLPIHYTIENTDFDVAVVNSTAKTWTLRDYAEKFAANGIEAYEEGLEFADRYQLPIGTAFALLFGTTTFTNCQEYFVSGEFRIKDREWADSVAGIYVALSRMAPVVKNAKFVEACMAACRVEDFDPKRLIQNASRCRDKFAGYSSRDGYLEMLEEIYNFGRTKMLPLKVSAVMAMRERNAAKKAAANNKAKAKQRVAMSA